ncbi:MAG: class I SAM-dependent methyltransferase [Bacteroidota bacterium]
METTPLTYAQCPACRSDKIFFVLSAKDYTVSQEKFEVWHCQNCQLRFTQHIPGENEIGKYYQSEEYISHSNTSKGLINTLYQWVRNYTLGQKRKLIEKLSGRKSGALLDIGCGTGEFLGTMKTAGWQTLGLEPDEGARAQAKSQGVEVRETEQLFSLEADRYDVITMWHVLEHVHRLHEYLEKIYSLLKKDGLLIIAVPNYSSRDAEHYQAEWAAYDVPRHLYHFHPESMRNLIEQHGFSLEKMQHMPFDGFYVSLLSEKYRHGKSRLVPAFLQGLRSFLKSSGNSATGSSVMYMIRK